MIGPLRGGLTN